MDHEQFSLRLYKAHKFFLRALLSQQILTSELSEFQTRELLVLEILGDHPWVPMKEIARQLGIAANTATGIINRMVRKRLVQRRTSESDRRVVEIALTDKGQSAYQLFLDLHVEYGAGLLNKLTHEEAETYVTLIEKLVDDIESGEDKT